MGVGVGGWRVHSITNMSESLNLCYDARQFIFEEDADGKS